MSDLYVTVAEAARILGISEIAVRRRADRGTLPAEVGPDRRRMIPVSALVKGPPAEPSAAGDEAEAEAPAEALESAAPPVVEASSPIDDTAVTSAPPAPDAGGAALGGTQERIALAASVAEARPTPAGAAHPPASSVAPSGTVSDFAVLLHRYEELLAERGRLLLELEQVGARHREAVIHVEALQARVEELESHLEVRHGGKRPWFARRLTPYDGPYADAGAPPARQG